MVIAYRNGNPVRLGDVARVYDGVEQDKTASWYQGVRNISLMIQKQPGSNVVQVVDDIKALLPSVRAQLPPSVPLDVRMDRSESIRESRSGGGWVAAISDRGAGWKHPVEKSAPNLKDACIYCLYPRLKLLDNVSSRPLTLWKLHCFSQPSTGG